MIRTFRRKIDPARPVTMHAIYGKDSALPVHCRKRLAVMGDPRQPLLALVPEPIQLPASSAALPAAPG